MTIEDRWWAEMRRHGSARLTETPPSVLARCAATALGMDGAGIALMQPLLRLPIGSSTEDVRRAEQLQATLGEGPCLTSAQQGEVVMADSPTMLQSWPVYAEELLNQTRFRSAVAVPLWTLERPFAALNLYSERADLDHVPTVVDLGAELGDPVSAVLLGALSHPEEPPSWWDEETLVRRLRVWTAVGMIMEAGDVDDHEALDVLRGYAFGQGRSIDNVGQRVADRVVSTGEVLGRA